MDLCLYGQAPAYIIEIILHNVEESLHIVFGCYKIDNKKTINFQLVNTTTA